MDADSVAVAQVKRSFSCARGLRRSAFVTMVKPADLRDGNDAPRARRSRRSGHRRILVERQMRARSLVVRNVRLQHASLSLSKIS
jgi:hypothetical protein